MLRGGEASMRLRAPCETRKFMNCFELRTRQRISAGMERLTSTEKAETILGLQVYLGWKGFRRGG